MRETALQTGWGRGRNREKGCHLKNERLEGGWGGQGGWGGELLGSVGGGRAVVRRRAEAMEVKINHQC